MNVEEVTIESDENGWELHVLTTDEGRMVFNVHGVAEELLREVTTKIGPWLLEGYRAAREYAPLAAVPGPEPGESLLDYYRRTGDQDGVLAAADELRDRERGK